MSTHVRHCQLRATQRVISTRWRASKLQCRSVQHASIHSDRGEVASRGSPDTYRGHSAYQLAVKDNISTQGAPTTCASTILAGTNIPFEATIVRQLRRQGAEVIKRKAGMDEFGMGSHSTTSAYETIRNVAPLQEYSAGGSSGGSAVVVKKGEADLALGTDTGGSVRMPAAYTGIVGYKPSYGMLSRWGVVPYANSLDTVGLLAGNVGVIGREIIDRGLYIEHDPNDPTSLSRNTRARCTAQRTGYESWQPNDGSSLKGLTFGIPLEYNIQELDPRVRQGWIDALVQISSQGGRVIPVSLPTTKNALSAYYVLAPAEAASNLSKYDGVRYGPRLTDGQSDALDGVLYAKTRGSGFGDEVKRRILLGSYTLSSEAMDNYFIQAQKVRRLVRRDFDRVFKLSNPLHDEQVFDLSDMDDTISLENKLGPSQVDFLVCPTAPTPPPLLSEVEGQSPLHSYMNDVFTVPASLAGLPAISIPMDLPFDPTDPEERMLNFGGLQIIGQYWDDARVLSVATQLSSLVRSHVSAD
ncbi:amidase signature enzyme [Xylariomycetidae sp. FL2044]|nr:amidase signature enzyme [Xylariomycetidae sp. FL2044]